MKVFFGVHKIIKFTIYNTDFYLKWRYLSGVGEDVVYRTIYQGCQFNVYFIQCQTFTDISGIVKGFVQYVRNYLSDMYVFNLQLLIKA